jgi:hypothetical protein
MTEQGIYDYVRRKLGAGVVCVELTDDQLADALDRAKLWMQMWVGQQKNAVLTGGGGTEFALPTDCESPVEVIFAASSDSLFDTFRWAGVEVNASDLTTMVPNQGYVDIVQRMQYLELGKRVLSAERAWEHDRARNLLIISPAPAAGEQVILVYLMKTIALTYLKAYELQLLMDYTFALSMETLGYIRTKFAEIPTASGSTSMNGDTLLANAQQLMDKCEEKARALAPPIPLFVG